MAMDWKTTLSDITAPNGAIDDLKKLLVKAAYQSETLQSTFTAKYSVINGEHLGFVGDLSDIGWKGAPCNPTYKTPTTEVAEKVWEIGKWQAPLTYCYETFEKTIAEYALKGGTDMGDLTGTEIAQILITNPLTNALVKMYWRIIWFGDTQGANLTSGVDSDLFTMTDGLWKRLFAVSAENEEQHVTIDANSASTAAEQKSAIKESGVATAIFDDLIENADPRIAGLDGAGIFCTKSLKDALAHDAKKVYNYQLTWEMVTDGVEIGYYNGVKITAISIWDRLIQQYFNDGTKLNLPHRAFFGTPAQLYVGTPANDIISDVETFFDQKERTYNIYAAGKLGTLVGEDELFNIAY